VKAGDIVLADFQGSLGTKRRPRVVVSTALYHAEGPDVLVAPITSKTEKETAKTDVILENWPEAGLDRPSAVRLFLNTRSKSKVSPIGRLSDRDWHQVQERLRISLAI